MNARLDYADCAVTLEEARGVIRRLTRRLGVAHETITDQRTEMQIMQHRLCGKLHPLDNRIRCPGEYDVAGLVDALKDIETQGGKFRDGSICCGSWASGVASRALAKYDAGKGGR